MRSAVKPDLAKRKSCSWRQQTFSGYIVSGREPSIARFAQGKPEGSTAPGKPLSRSGITLLNSSCALAAPLQLASSSLPVSGALLAASLKPSQAAH
jgi:hypothetical protein